MVLTKKPFTNYTTDEDKKDPLESGKVFTIRLNAEEYKQLREDMKDFNIARESTMFKFLADTGRNVLHGTFGRDKLRWIFGKRRVKEEFD